MNIPTLVAPGGSHTKALVASAYGAEEVYLGVPFTSLRMRQNKLYTFDSLKTTIDQLHLNGTKALLTMNIFPRNTDIQIFESVVEKIASLQPDGIIFSDPGTFATIRHYLPNTPLHLSTQTTTLNYAGVKFWADLGVKRIVLARELHLNEIAKIKQEVPEIELEVFVHGAMCMTYSGRCLLGDYLGGRAGNRGECNHACRFNYKVFIEEERRTGKLLEVIHDDDGEHLLSSRDLCTIHRLEELLPHIDAMKIEGRSKSEFYVSTITKAYKHVRDAILHNTPIDEQIIHLVNIVPHRAYREGFLFNPLTNFPDGEHLSEAERSNAPGSASTTSSLGTAGPLFNRNYFGTFTPETIEQHGKIYHHLDPKEELKRGMLLHYLSPNAIGDLEILDIVDKKGKSLEKADCNTPDVFVQTSLPLHGRENIYTDPILL